MQTATLRLALAVATLLLTTEQVSAQAPTLTNQLPSRNARAATRNTNVAATSSQALPAGTTLNVFSQKAGGKKTGTTAISGNSISFDPAVDFKPGEVVTATLHSGATNLAHVWQFTAATTGGTGTFGPGLTTTNTGAGNMEVGDLDNDGALDAVSVGTQIVTIYRNTGSGQLTNSGYIPINNPIAIKLADVDGDGYLDFLVTNIDILTIRFRVTVYRNNGAGTFTQGASTDIADPTNPTQFLSRIATGDVDGDGDLDLLYTLTAATNQLVVHLNNGAGVFGAPFSRVVVNSSARAVQHVLGDVDGDGDLDAISMTSDVNGGPIVYFNDGTGRFANPAQYSAYNFTGSISAGDIDGDGDLDLAVPTFVPNFRVSLLLNNGDGSFATGTTIPAGIIAANVALGDLNGDGRLDMIVAGDQISALLNAGNGTFTAKPIVALANVQHELLGLSDMDGDGDLDITSKAGSTIYISLNQNTVTHNQPRAEAAFQVWPNPAGARTNLHISLPSGVSAAEARLHTLLGQPVREHKFSGNTTELATAGLASGVYLLTVQPAGQAPTTRRIVLE